MDARLEGLMAGLSLPGLAPFEGMSAVGRLAAAAGEGDAAQLRELLEAGADVNAAAQTGRTASLAAAARGHDECLALLIEAGADINRADSEGSTPALAACEGGHPACLKLLIDANCELGARRKDGASTAYLAARSGSAECILAVVNAGADVRSATLSGETPTYAAAEQGNVVGLCLLVGLAVDVNEARRSDGATPAALDIILAIARKRGDEETVRIFEQHVATNAAVNAVAQRARAQAAVCLSCHKEGVPPGATGQGGDAQVTLLQCEGCGDALYCSKEVRKDEEARG
eukprot:PRCOL_00004341-RA